jgi:hypothetical protein
MMLDRDLKLIFGVVFVKVSSSHPAVSPVIASQRN